MIWQFSHGSHSHIHSLLNKTHHLPPLCTLSCPSCLSCPVRPPLVELPAEAALAARGLVRLLLGLSHLDAAKVERPRAVLIGALSKVG